MALLRVLPWMLWAALVLFSVATYGGLPAEIPRKINAAGIITSAAPRSLFNWMLLPVIAAATQALLSFINAVLPKQPELFNFPEKDRFLKIPAAFQAPVIERMRDVMDIVGAAVMALLFVVQVGLWRAAMGVQVPAMLPVILALTVALMPLTLVLVSRVNSAVDEAEKRWRASEPKA